MRMDAGLTAGYVRRQPIGSRECHDREPHGHPKFGARRPRGPLPGHLRGETRLHAHLPTALPQRRARRLLSRRVARPRAFCSRGVRDVVPQGVFVHQALVPKAVHGHIGQVHGATGSALHVAQQRGRRPHRQGLDDVDDVELLVRQSLPCSRARGSAVMPGFDAGVRWREARLRHTRRQRLQHPLAARIERHPGDGTRFQGRLPEGHAGHRQRQGRPVPRRVLREQSGGGRAVDREGMGQVRRVV
mmetsp:Transcript_12049/g.34424  ORF Transcript_12049/g.34424 Transcript_12049/m.34424 type:complete len:245 (-) Transcript_12049:500-1234(-)